MSLRDPRLDPLFAGVSSLPGIGPRGAKALRRLLAHPESAPEPRLIDLLFHLPVGLVDRSFRPKLADARIGEVATVRVRVERHRGPPPGRMRAPFRIDTADETGTLTLVYFNASPQFVQKLFPIGATLWVSGRMEMYDGFLQMVHPDRVVPEGREHELAAAEAVYPLVEGVTQGLLSRAVSGALGKLRADRRFVGLPEWIAVAGGLPSFLDALAAAHNPERPEDLEPTAPARLRLAFDELLANQLALGLIRQQHRKSAGRPSVGDGRIARAIEAALPFRLTGAQSRALAEIRSDLAAPERMLRLLQGDVGSGKTVVALLAAATVIEAGRQAVLMAPTEILARQHLATIAPLAGAAGLRTALLTGRERGRPRDQILKALEAGLLDLLVGTHALFQEGVAFRDLALAIVDEQHRFGVQQRLALAEKGAAVDVLVMTATPIPRTLVMTSFGDMDLSVLDEKPPGRKPVDTRLVSLDRLDEVIAAIGRAVEAGARVYWVCPLVAASEELDVAAAEERFAALQAIFPGKPSLVHGKMRGAEKDAALERFVSGETPILVATTVIEVGVNVPEASVMVIEHAERFGLAQLHQLRGRIGRGETRSTCLLLYKGPLGEVAEARLKVLRETEDGFRIAEEDLRLRGQGELLGTKQSGAPDFRLARLEAHGELLRLAHQDAANVLASDPTLSGERGRALRLLLQTFERQEAARLIAAG